MLLSDVVSSNSDKGYGPGINQSSERESVGFLTSGECAAAQCFAEDESAVADCFVEFVITDDCANFYLS